MNNLANYTQSPIPDYAGNPLIEALPPVLTEADAARAIAHFPAGPDNERHLGKELRLHCIDRLKTLIQPLPIHLELESAVSSILRTGYVSRNPVNAATWRHLHTLSTNRRDLALFHSSASTFSLVGLSGIGKTTALNSVLSLCGCASWCAECASSMSDEIWESASWAGRDTRCKRSDVGSNQRNRPTPVDFSVELKSSEL